MLFTFCLFLNFLDYVIKVTCIEEFENLLREVDEYP